MDKNRSARDRGAEKPDVGPGYDYEYDEAHGETGQFRSSAVPHHEVSAPQMELEAGGDYGYDEAHDFGAR